MLTKALSGDGVGSRMAAHVLMLGIIPSLALVIDVLRLGATIVAFAVITLALHSTLIVMLNSGSGTPPWGY
jgi:hypothetical protein